MEVWPFSATGDFIDRPILSERSTFHWNSLLRHSPPLRSLFLYSRFMLPSHALPNKFTFTFLLRAASAAAHFTGLLHAHLTVLGLHADPFLRSALIAAYSSASSFPRSPDFYYSLAGPHPDAVLSTALLSALARAGHLDAARAAFDDISEPTPVSFAALISAYESAGRHLDALDAFRGMRRAGLAPTEAALVSAASSAARLGALPEGKLAHREAIVFLRRPLSPELGTALLTMYASCGCLDSARRAFDEMPHRDQCAWTAMLMALASHGYGAEALRLFDEMLRRGITPDHVTYVGVLHACSHIGLVEDARKHFNRMVHVHGIEARAEHYGCLVDALGRVGKVEEAWEVVKGMPMAPDKQVVKSLLSSCCCHGYAEYAEWAADRLVSMDAGNASAYILLSNMYAGMAKWEDYTRVRKLMRVRGVTKDSGCSTLD